MKFLNILIWFLLIPIGIFAQEKDYSLAKVGKKILGVYIFIACEPANEYDYIGTVKVFWNSGDPDAAYIELINKAKRKYSNFNAIIFKDEKFESADLIKFRGLEISGGGLRIGNNIIYRDRDQPIYGKIIQLDNRKQKASFQYSDEYGDKKTNTVPYIKLSIVPAEDYENLIEQQNIEIQTHKFSVAEKVSWSIDNKINYGEVELLNIKSHYALVKNLNLYGEEKTMEVNFLKLAKVDEKKYLEFINNQNIEIQKYKFLVGEKVSYVDDKIVKYGEIENLNNDKHIASIKNLNIFGEEKVSEIRYLELTKVVEVNYQEEILKYKNEINKYKFQIGENVIWSKGGLFNKKNDEIQVEVVTLNDMAHEAKIKFIDTEKIEHIEIVSYLKLTKINTTDRQK